MEKDNKRIAEFMGFPTQTDVVDDRTKAYYVGDIINTDNTDNENEDGVFHTDDMRFHTSWDWLMPVVSKITRDEILIENEYRESIMDTVPYGLIEDTYKVVVEFVKMYNTKKKGE